MSDAIALGAGRQGRSLARLLRAALLVPALLIVGVQVAPIAGYHVYSIEGGSMHPSIPLGAAVLVAPAPDLKPGDVITFEIPGGTTVTHRIVGASSAADGLHYRTQGDANDSTDATLVPASWVVGKVTAVVPLAGFALAWLRSALAVAAVLVLALLLLDVLRAPGRGGSRRARAGTAGVSRESAG